MNRKCTIKFFFLRKFTRTVQRFTGLRLEMCIKTGIPWDMQVGCFMYVGLSQLSDMKHMEEKTLSTTHLC